MTGPSTLQPPKTRTRSLPRIVSSSSTTTAVLISSLCLLATPANATTSSFLRVPKDSIISPHPASVTLEATRTPPPALAAKMAQTAAPQQDAYLPPNDAGISSHAIVFFLVAIAFFLVSLMWHLYIRFGWDKDGLEQLDSRALEAMDVEMDRVRAGGVGNGKTTMRGEGAWLSQRAKAS